jgi:hypothetical protein
VSVERSEHQAPRTGPEGTSDPGALEVDGQEPRRIAALDEKVVRRKVSLEQARLVESPG